MSFQAFQVNLIEVLLYTIYWGGWVAILIDQTKDAFIDYFKNKNEIEYGLMASSMGSSGSGSSKGRSGGNSGYNPVMNIIFRALKNPIATAILGIQLVLTSGLIFFGVPMLPISLTRHYGF